ncbi:serine/threonine protein kinase [Streptosporangium roseum]|uniref:serine/threonine protein kinase n=1 Tax=Streptosporangium roseum TaxID=2001 RepID=UPI0012DEA993|nr:serine/threonine protein kinase [Streptosporangium roseum]
MSAAEASTSLASGEPPINFRAHEVRTGNAAGARDEFEEMIGMLVKATHPGARMIAANPGDWGIDVIVGELSGVVVIWQAKYYMPVVTESHQDEIRKSFAAAIKAAKEKGHQLRQWVLCVPSSMDAPTDKWWGNWKTKQQKITGVHIELWHEVELRTRLISPDAAHVRRHYYDPYRQPIDDDRIPVHRLNVEAAVELETALFVRQLREAGHLEVSAAKQQFFNAELVAREIADKAVPAELSALIDADATVHGIWESRFNEAWQRDPSNPALPGLHATVMRDLREAITTFPKTLRLGPVHGCGLIHRVVDDGRAGWVTHWSEIALRHTEQNEPLVSSMAEDVHLDYLPSGGVDPAREAVQPGKESV